MDCVFCKRGERRPGKVMHTFHRGETIVVVKNIPADVCDFCGEPYLSDEVAEVIERLIDDAVRKGAEVEILRYATEPKIQAGKETSMTGKQARSI